MPYVTDIEIIFQNIRRKAPKIHCLTNPVTMQDVANLLLQPVEVPLWDKMKKRLQRSLASVREPS